MAKKPNKAKSQAATAEDRLRVAKGEVADAEAEVARLSNELGAARLQVKAADAALAEARSEIQSLQATDAAESEIIAELKGEVEKLKDRLAEQTTFAKAGRTACDVITKEWRKEEALAWRLKIACIGLTIIAIIGWIL